jgi:hypothetical protein
MTRSRRALSATGALTLVATGALSLGPLVSSVSAADELGAGLGYFSLNASAPAVQGRVHDTTNCFATPAGQNGCELVLPEATSQLRNGPVGRGVAAIVWPGALAADIGSLIITASDGKVPDSARMLNDPVRAQAETNTTHETASYDAVPGTSMKATAHGAEVTADALTGSAQATPLGSFGQTRGTSSSKLTGVSTAIATAHTSAQDISIGGVVTIGSVTSDAQATTDGVTASAKGSTAVSDMKVAGIPVTVDGDGVHAMGNGPVPLQTADAAVNSALAAAGMKILLGAPSGKPVGPSVTYNAGSLIISWMPAPQADFLVTIGGANVSVDSAPAISYKPPPPFTPGGTGSASNPGTFVPGSPGTFVPGSPGIAGGTTTPNLTPGGAPDLPVTAGGEAPILASRKISLPDGLSPAFAIFGVLGSLFFMLGLRRLPDRVLEATASLCPLEENR